MHSKQTSQPAAADDLTITIANTRIYADSPCPSVSRAVYESWAAGEWAGNDASWFAELGQLGAASAR